MTDPQLMRFLNFDESDLQTNRNGRISQKQKARLDKEARSEKGCFSILGVFLLLVASVGVIGALAFAPASNGKERLYVLIGFGVIWPLVWGATSFGFLRHLFTKLTWEVKKAQGSINIVKTVRKSYNSDTHRTTEHTVYELRVGGHTIDGNAGLPNFMKNGDVYAVYYTHFNMLTKQTRILSVEPLADADVASTRQAVIHDDVEVVECLKKGDVMGAIKAHRSIHSSDFEEAKSLVEEMKVRLGY